MHYILSIELDKGILRIFTTVDLLVGKLLHKSSKRMVSGEVTLQIVATLSGAALVSVLLITFINAEAVSRISRPGPDIENVNVWQLITSKLTHRKSSKLHNTTQRPDDRTTLRQLRWIDEEPHHLRHGRHRGHNTTRSRHDSSPPGIRPDSCYSGNEVLVIIGVTCLLNFAFVLLVMGCVYYCSSNVSSDRVPRFDSVLVESETDSDDSKSGWDSQHTILSLNHLYRHKTPSHSMEQLLFVD